MMDFGCLTEKRYNYM